MFGISSSAKVSYLPVFILFLLTFMQGLPLLIRVGLAVISCCRRAILECKTEESLLRYITAPPPTWFPPTVDAFITVVMSAKVKDDDVRKQRAKLAGYIIAVGIAECLTFLLARGLVWVRDKLAKRSSAIRPGSPDSAQQRSPSEDWEEIERPGTSIGHAV